MFDPGGFFLPTILSNSHWRVFISAYYARNTRVLWAYAYLLFPLLPHGKITKYHAAPLPQRGREMYWHFVLSPKGDTNPYKPGLCNSILLRPKNKNHLSDSLDGLIIFYVFMIFMTYKHYMTDYFQIMVLSCIINLVLISIINWLGSTSPQIQWMYHNGITTFF